ncbi:MAG: lysoplasmalogenase [Myxococcota bacterium]|nr:lysoplasmalogenase [Myxococcota bacterium]
MTPFLLLTILAVAALLAANFRNSRAGIWLAKPLASTGFIAVALTAHTEAGAGSADAFYAPALIVGLLLCWLGDVLLIPENRPGIFRAGIFAFLLGHVAYLAAFLSLGLDPAWAVMTGVLLCLPAAGVLRLLGPRVPPELTLAVRSYVLVISAMLVCAAGAVGGGANPSLLLGAALFYVSDLAVARDRFLAPGFINAAWGLPLYYAAQLILARTLA